MYTRLLLLSSLSFSFSCFSANKSEVDRKKQGSLEVVRVHDLSAALTKGAPPSEHPLDQTVKRPSLVRSGTFYGSAQNASIVSQSIQRDPAPTPLPSCDSDEEGSQPQDLTKSMFWKPSDEDAEEQRAMISKLDEYLESSR